MFLHKVFILFLMIVEQFRNITFFKQFLLKAWSDMLTKLLPHVVLSLK